MAKEPKNRMVPSERIRGRGPEPENIKLVGKRLSFHCLILGLLHNDLNSGDITSPFCVLQQQNEFCIVCTACFPLLLLMELWHIIGKESYNS